MVHGEDWKIVGSRRGDLWLTGDCRYELAYKADVEWVVFTCGMWRMFLSFLVYFQCCKCVLRGVHENPSEYPQS